MKHYFFSELVKIKKSINLLQDDPDNIDCFVSIQNELLLWHEWLEQSVRKRKKRLIELKQLKRSRTNTKNMSIAFKNSIKICKRQIEELSDLKLWSRHIGNSLPHIYYDKYDLRPYAYSLDKQELKELSGDILGKEGQDFEKSCFDLAISKGIKALMNDLTSIMRHGDLTLMDKDIPYLMELKQSEACKKKGEKQLKSMKAVQEYIITDESESLRGGNYLSKRIAMNNDEITRIDEFNKHLELTKVNGHHFSAIEEGVYCYSFYSGTPPEKLREHMSFIDGLKQPMFISLNELKNNLDLSLFYPYSLSLKDPEVFASFISGYLSIYLFIDWEHLSSIARELNVDIKLESDDYCLSLTSGNCSTVKSFTLTKALVEFSSLGWAVREACNLYHQTLDLYNHQVKEKI
ncbi:hypothetical protein MT391_20400 [Vibrio sp. 1-Bac 57]